MSQGLESCIHHFKYCCYSVCRKGRRDEFVRVIRPGGEELVLPDLEPKERLLTKGEVKSLHRHGTFPVEEVVKQLERMRFGACALMKETVEVKVPAYRADILHNYDLVEDIAKGYGYENIKVRIPETYTAGKSHPISLLRSL